jgi:hypothetical protein
MQDLSKHHWLGFTNHWSTTMWSTASGHVTHFITEVIQMRVCNQRPSDQTLWLSRLFVELEDYDYLLQTWGLQRTPGREFVLSIVHFCFPSVSPQNLGSCLQYEVDLSGTDMLWGTFPFRNKGLILPHLVEVLLENGFWLPTLFGALPQLHKAMLLFRSRTHSITNLHQGTKLSHLKTHW